METENLELQQLKKAKSEKVLEGIYNLPSMSGIVMEVTRMLDDPSTSTAKLSKLIGRDQGMTSKILSISNSALYGLPRKVSTIDFAILVMGYQDTKNIVLALSMVEAFKNKTDKLLNQKDFWLHSVVTGNIAKRLSDDLGYSFGGEAFIAGLLHDLGIPIIHKYFHSVYEQIVTLVNSETMKHLQAENELLGLTHQDIGKYLGKKWNLPSHLCNAVEFHHKPSETKEDLDIVSIVHVADYITQKFSIGQFTWDRTFEVDEVAIKELRFDSIEQLDEHIEKYQAIIEEEMHATQVF